MFYSCCVWSMPGPVEAVFRDISGLGFSRVDVRPSLVFRKEISGLLEKWNLQLACVGISTEFPSGTSLEDSSDLVTSEALAFVENTLREGSKLGASYTYLVPGYDSSKRGMRRYTENLIKVLDIASTYKIKVCLEHFPGMAMESVASVLDLIKNIGHPNLYLLLDIGHAMITGENIEECISKADTRLGYIHLDDNDGKEDLHLGLTEGVMTINILENMYRVLERYAYDGPLSFELAPNLVDPYGSMKRSFQTIKILTGKM